MAEVAGLVISGVGLAALTDKVTALFGTIDSGRNLGDDYEEYITQLEMARLAYMQWLEAVKKISDAQGSSRMQVDLSKSDKQTAETLERILGLIEKAFKDAEKKGAIYNIDEAQLASKPTSSTWSTEISRLGDNFRERADERQKNVPFRSKVRWALKDKTALKDLVTKVSENVQKLNKAFPVVSKIIQDSADQDVRRIANPRNAQNIPVLEQIEKIAARTDPALQRSAEQAIRDGHTYHDMYAGNKARAQYGNEINPGPVDEGWTRRNNHYERGRVEGEARALYGDRINPGKSILDD